MQSVMEQITKARKNKLDNIQTHPNLTVTEGCHVTARFNPVGDYKVMEDIGDMLRASYMKYALAATEGEQA